MYRIREMLKTILKILLTLVVLLGGGVLAVLIRDRLREQGSEPDRVEVHLPAPVEVASLSRGELVQRRIISGTLEASAEFMVAPKVSGRVVLLNVDISDRIALGQTVARLDDAEHQQAVAQAEADLAVANAQLVEASGALEIAERNRKRVQSLLDRDMVSELEVDTVLADHVARTAQVAVAKARVTRAEAAVEAERIRLGYTRVVADWGDGDAERLVAERYVDAGETVSANAPLFRVIELDPVIGVVFVPERDYARLRPEQPVTLQTDAYPDRSFPGVIARIAPIFRESTRQARVELRIDNPGQELRPGMFIRATIELARVADALIVPYDAFTEREGVSGVFVVTPDGRAVRWCPARIGIREGERVQLIAAGDLEPDARVVTLGQHLVDDGSPISLAAEQQAGGESVE